MKPTRGGRGGGSRGGGSPGCSRDTDKLVAEDNKTKVYSRVETVGRRKTTKYKVVTGKPPEFEIEPDEKLGEDVFYLRKAENQQMIGLLNKDGLDKAKGKVEKMAYLSKLDLIPTEYSKEQYDELAVGNRLKRKELGSEELTDQEPGPSSSSS